MAEATGPAESPDAPLSSASKRRRVVAGIVVGAVVIAGAAFGGGVAVGTSIGGTAGHGQFAGGSAPTGQSGGGPEGGFGQAPNSQNN